MTTFERNTFARDLRASLALSDARKAENAAARARARGKSELVAELERDSERRGFRGQIDWADYFRNAWIS
jgi:hypothetical protein